MKIKIIYEKWFYGKGVEFFHINIKDDLLYHILIRQGLEERSVMRWAHEIKGIISPRKTQMPGIMKSSLRL